MIKQLLAIFMMVCAGLVALAQQVVLSGTQSGYRLLSKDTCYLLRGNYEVPSPFTLEIEEGTVIMGEKSTLGTLIIEPGATLLAVGTVNEPIIFTTDQTGGSKAPGDWGGIVIGGEAPNNGPLGTVDVTRNSVQYTGGGNIAADNSGTLRYVRIEFGGGGDLPDNSDPAAIVLLSVGSGTTIEYVQTSYSGRGGFVAKGGTFEADHLVSYDDREVHFRFIDGNTSKLQYILGLRMGVTAHTGLGYASNGVVIENNLDDNDDAPLTSPAISNMTLLTRGYCELEMDPNVENGILFSRYGAGNIWNSAVAGYRLFGLYLSDLNSVGQTSTDLLNFSYNSMMDNQSPEYGAISWTGGCGISMSDWINGPTSTCEETDNDLSLTSFGYDESICEPYCEDRPTLTYTGSDLSNTNFGGVFSDGFFDNTTNIRGAIQGTDWTLDWAKFCPEDECVLARSSSRAPTPATLQFVPNPATGNTTLVFDAPTTGKAQIVVMDKISGRVLHTVATTITQPGTQRIAIALDGLRDNLYTVQLTLNGQVWYGKLSVQ